MAARLTIDFNSGTDGVNLTTGGGIDSVVATGNPQYSTANAKHGARGMFIPSGTAAAYFRHLVAANTATHSGSVYVKTIAQASGSSNVVQMCNNADSPLYGFGFNADGKFKLFNETGATAASSTMSWAASTWYRWDWQADLSTPTSPTITWRIFTDLEGVTPAETIGPIVLSTSKTFERWRVGGAGSSSGARSLALDTFRLSNSLEWLGPFDPPSVADENVIYGPVDSYQSGSSLATQAKVRTPKDLMTGDALLAVLSISATQGVAPSMPASFTTLVSVQAPSGGCVVYASRIAPGTPGDVSTLADTELTFSWTTAAKASLALLPIGGVDDAAPFSVPTVALEAVSQVNHDSPAFTPAVSGRRLNVATLKASTIQTLTKPFGDTARGEVYGLKANGNAIAFSDSGTNVTATLQAAKTWVSDIAAGSGTMLSVVVKPSAVAIGTRKFQGATRFMSANAATSTSFKVVARTVGATSIRLAYSTAADMSGASFISAQVPDSKGYVRFTVPTLTAGTQYYYRLMDTPAGLSERAISDIGAIKTLKASGAQQNFNFAFGASQTNESSVSAALDNIRAWNPDFMVHLGDFHHYDPNETVTLTHERYYESQIENSAGLKTFLRSLNLFHVRSDRDAGPDESGDSNQPFNENSIAAWKNVFPNPTLADVSSPTRGLYHSFVVGRVRFIAIDTRNSDRSAGALAQGSSKTMLGATQKAWLKDRLLDPEPVKVILSDEGWNRAASTSVDKAAWWSYDDERTEIGNFIVTNNLRVMMCVGNDNKLHASTGTFNTWGEFPVVGAGPLDNVGGGNSVAEQNYSTDAVTRGAQYGRMEVTDDGSTISITYRGWDALTDTQKFFLTETFNTDSPVILTGAGNETVVTIANGQDIATVKPDNVGVGDYMVAHIFHRTANGAGFDIVPGWTLIGLVNSTYTMGLYYRKADASDTAGKVYTWHTSAASSRGVGRIAKMTGAHATAPIDIVGTLAANSGTTSIDLPGVDPETDNTLLVAAMGAGRSSTTAPVFSAPPGMGSLTNNTVNDGASTSTIGMATQSLGNDNATGNRVAPITNAAANSVGFLFAVRALNAAVAPSISRVATHVMTSSGFKVRYRVFNASSVRLAVSTVIGMTSPVFSTVSTPDADGFGTVTITGLAPDTNYWYRLELNGAVNATLTVPVRTHEANPSEFSFAVGSCAVVGSNDSVFTAIKDRVGPDAKKARFFSHLGDWDYTWGNGGVTPNDAAQIINARELAFMQPNQAALFREIPLDYVWSDVDFGGSNSDGTSIAKTTLQNVYRKLWESHTLPSTVGGIQRAWTIGRVRFVHTDSRSMSSNKSDADLAAKTLLGAEQKAWLKAEMLAAKAAKQLVFWLHDNEWVRAQESPNGARDGWSVYHTERLEISAFITANSIDLHMAHGDNHSLMADDGTNNPFGGFPWVCVAPMHQQAPVPSFTVTNGKYPDTGDGTIIAAHQYGWFDVEDDGTDITVVFKGFTSEGTQRITMTSVFNIPQDDPPVITKWNGTTEEPMEADGIWNGVTTVPAQLTLAP